MPLETRESIVVHAINPTRGQVEIATRYFGNAFGWSKEQVRSLFDFAIGSVASANAMIEFAILLVRSQVAESKIPIPNHDRDRLALAEMPLRKLKNAIAAAKERDERGGEGRLLEGIPFGQKLNLSVPERRLVVEMLKKAFAPPAGTPVEGALYRTVVGRGGMYLRLADFVIRQFLDEEETAQYVSDLKAARAVESGTPAPKADAEEEEVAQAS